MSALENKVIEKIDNILLKFEALGKTRYAIPKIKFCYSNSRDYVSRLDYCPEKQLARFFLDTTFAKTAPKLHIKCKITGMIVQLVSLLYFGNIQTENIRFIESIIIKEKL